jgi:hypothetical protein
MPKKTPTSSKPAKVYTSLHELVATFSGRERQLVVHVEEKERVRLLNASLDDEWEHGFYGVDLRTGLGCLINTVHLTRFNLLDYLPGVQFEAEPDLTDKQWAKQFEAREASDDPVVLRVWLRGEKEPIVHHDIEYAAWSLAQTCLHEDGKFIHFIDEDGEDVIYSSDHLDAIEMADPFYLNEEQIEKWLRRHVPDSDEPTSAPGTPES